MSYEECYVFKKLGKFQMSSLTYLEGVKKRNKERNNNRVDRALQSWQITWLVETTRPVEWADDALQPRMANHLVEVPQTMILTTLSSPIAEADITAQLQPYLDNRATLDWLMTRIHLKMFIGDIDRNQLQPNNTNNKHRAQANM